jgi:hypothetical protein
MSIKDAVYQGEAQREWEEARRKALWTRLSALIRGKDIHLVSFEEVSERLRLRNQRYKGKLDIPVDHIIGSVGRYNDFLEAFLPTTPQMEERWERIAALFLDASSGGVPPIEAYQVGELYFVKDGNHRVSVAKQLEMPTIEAYVWEYPLALDTSQIDTLDIDSMLMAMEKQDFFEETRLDQLRPGFDLHLNLPGGYQELADEIREYQTRLDAIDQDDPNHAPTSFEEAVTAWYDMVYEPSIRIIKLSGILDHFPARTPADLFIWVRRRQHELEEKYGKNVRLTQVIRSLDEQQHNPLNRLWKTVSGWVKVEDKNDL